MSALGQKQTFAVHQRMSTLGQKWTFRDLLDHLVNVWNPRRATVAKCFKRFVKLGFKELRANRRACSELKHDGYRLQVHVRDAATLTAKQRP
jgi:ATP-dependent DNA ligase